MSIHSRPRNPYRVARFIKNLVQRHEFWFTPRSVFNKRNFLACWYSADENHFNRYNLDDEDFCDEPNCVLDRDHEPPHMTLEELLNGIR